MSKERRLKKDRDLKPMYFHAVLMVEKSQRALFLRPSLDVKKYLFKFQSDPSAKRILNFSSLFFFLWLCRFSSTFFVNLKEIRNSENQIYCINFQSWVFFYQYIICYHQSSTFINQEHGVFHKRIGNICLTFQTFVEEICLVTHK